MVRCARRPRQGACTAARVASRRLREALAVIDAAEPTDDAGRLARAVRRLTRALGPVREIDVAIVELERAARRHGWSPELTGLFRRRLEQRARAAREAHGREGGQAGSCRRPRRRHESSPKRVASAPTIGRGRRALTARIVRRARAVLAASAAAGTIYVPERLHALRIAIKKLRYALELAAGHAGARGRRRASIAEARAASASDRFTTFRCSAQQIQAIDTVAQRRADRATAVGGGRGPRTRLPRNPRAGARARAGGRGVRPADPARARCAPARAVCRWRRRHSIRRLTAYGSGLTASTEALSPP